ncbi:MAG: type II secretion system F family protein [Kineosporiaceae bacterium]
MTTTQIALTAGGLIGLGIALLLWRLAPAHPDLRSVLDVVSPDRSLRRPEIPASASTASERFGLWLMRHLPLTGLSWVPNQQLALLRIPVHRYWGEKALFALIGLATPAVLGVLVAVVGVSVPVPLPVAGSLALALALSFLPDYNARSDAVKAREEFARALGAYVDLVALERQAGSGPRQAMEAAAAVGDSWVFRRLSEELARSRWSGVPPWDALTALADELHLPELAEVSDIMRLSGEEGAAVYTTLRARAEGLRAAMLAREQTKANAAGERMTFPVSALSLIFLLLLATPPVLRVLFEE